MKPSDFSNLWKYKMQREVFQGDESKIDKKLKLKAMNESYKLLKIMREGK